MYFAQFLCMDLEVQLSSESPFLDLIGVIHSFCPLLCVVVLISFCTVSVRLLCLHSVKSFHFTSVRYVGSCFGLLALIVFSYSVVGLSDAIFCVP